MNKIEQENIVLEGDVIQENVRWLTLSENSRLGAISDKRGNLI